METFKTLMIKKYRESSIHKYMKKALSDTAFIHRIEDKMDHGTSDTYILYKGVSVWIELKYTDSDSMPKFRPFQVIFLDKIYRNKGNGFVLIGVKENIYLFSAKHAIILRDSKNIDTNLAILNGTINDLSFYKEMLKLITKKK